MQVIFIRGVEATNIRDYLTTCWRLPRLHAPATVHIYADRKGWDLQSINVDVSLKEKDGLTTFERKLHLLGNLEERQRTRMLLVANSCPLHKILTGHIAINTQIA